MTPSQALSPHKTGALRVAYRGGRTREAALRGCDPDLDSDTNFANGCDAEHFAPHRRRITTYNLRRQGGDSRHKTRTCTASALRFILRALDGRLTRVPFAGRPVTTVTSTFNMQGWISRYAAFASSAPFSFWPALAASFRHRILPACGLPFRAAFQARYRISAKQRVEILYLTPSAASLSGPCPRAWRFLCFHSRRAAGRTYLSLFVRTLYSLHGIRGGRPARL